MPAWCRSARKPRRSPIPRSAIAGLLPVKFWIALLICVPATFIGVNFGLWAYRHLDDRRYDRVVVSLVLAMGVSLIFTSW